MDQLAFERITNVMSKEEFRLDLAEYIDKKRLYFNSRK